MRRFTFYRNSRECQHRNSKQSKLKGLIKDDCPSLDGGHGFFLYIPDQRYVNYYKWDRPKNYFESNPEYFSLDRNGKRTNRLQLCFSNRERARNSRDVSLSAVAAWADRGI